MRITENKNIILAVSELKEEDYVITSQKHQTAKSLSHGSSSSSPLV